MSAVRGRPASVEPLIAPGVLLELGDGDYQDSHGPLTLRVTAVSDAGPQWVAVSGIEILFNGDRGDRRSVLVSVAAIERANRGRTGI